MNHKKIKQYDICKITKLASSACKNKRIHKRFERKVKGVFSFHGVSLTINNVEGYRGNGLV